MADGLCHRFPSPNRTSIRRLLLYGDSAVPHPRGSPFLPLSVARAGGSARPPRLCVRALGAPPRRHQRHQPDDPRRHRLSATDNWGLFYTRIAVLLGVIADAAETARDRSRHRAAGRPYGDSACGQRNPVAYGRWRGVALRQTLGIDSRIAGAAAAIAARSHSARCSSQVTIRLSRREPSPPRSVQRRAIREQDTSLSASSPSSPG